MEEKYEELSKILYIQEKKKKKDEKWAKSMRFILASISILQPCSL